MLNCQSPSKKNQGYQNNVYMDNNQLVQIFAPGPTVTDTPKESEHSDTLF